MAQSSPFDGPSPDRLSKAESEDLSCSHSIPPDVSHTRLKQVRLPNRSVLLFSAHLCLSVVVGILAILGYDALDPSVSRHFKLLPPWSSEAPLFMTIFAVAAGATYLALARKKRL
ncbi:MAG: hypothetical protein WA001_01255 [Patescibacteria group bacterium]